MNINEEGKYYAAMVRKFRTEYKSKNLHGFCKDQKVSYTKMLYCLRDDSYRKPKVSPTSVTEELGLHPLVVETEGNVALESGIHPAVIKELVRLIAAYNEMNGQLVFSTHETCLFDQEILRTDEIWFAQKNIQGSTELYSLSDFNVHATVNVENGYQLRTA